MVGPDSETLRRGEVWWANFPPLMGKRPVVLVGRRASYRRRTAVITVLVTRRVRNLDTEVALGPSEGLEPCVANADTIFTFERTLLVNRAGVLDDDKMRELDEALRYALDLD